MSKTYWGIPPVTVKGPRGARGPNAQHALWGIWIHNNVTHPTATLMQEIREWWFLRKLGLLWASPVIALAAYIGYLSYTKGNGDLAVAAGALLLVALAVGVRLIRTRKNLQAMELMGHATECVVAYRYCDYEFDRALFEETMSLVGYEQFSGVDAEEIGRRLLEACDEAERWTDRNPRLIGKWLKRLPDIS